MSHAEKIQLYTELFKNDYSIVVHDMNRKILPIYHHNGDMAFFIDTDCESSIDILNQANKLKLFTFSYKWLFLSKNFTKYNQEHNLQRFDITYDSTVFVGEKQLNNEYYLNEIFKFSRTGILQYRLITRWTIMNKFQNYKMPVILSKNRKNLMGTNIAAATVITNNESFSHLWDYRDPHVDSLTKANFLLVNILLDYLNATKQFEYYDSWGYKSPSEKLYSGMIGSLQHGKAELGCTGLFVNLERIKVIDYLHPTTPSAIQFVYRQPALSYVSNLFTLPFSRTVWISVMGLFLLSIFVIYIITIWERKHNLNWKDEDDSFLEVVMLAIGAVCQQGTTYEPKSGTGKLVTFLIFTALLFIYVSYSAYIVVLLQSLSTNIRTLKDLLDSKLDYGLVEIVYNHFYFQAATEKIRKEIYEKKILPKGDNAFMTLEEGVKRLREGFFALHGEVSPIYTIISRTFLESEKCSLQNMQYIEASQFWLPVKKKGIYEEIFKIGLREMHEYGIQSREASLLYEKKPKCLGGGSNFVSVGLVDAGPAFQFLAFGFVVTGIVFIIEVLVNRYLNRFFKK